MTRKIFYLMYLRYTQVFRVLSILRTLLTYFANTSRCFCSINIICFKIYIKPRFIFHKYNFYKHITYLLILIFVLDVYQNNHNTILKPISHYIRRLYFSLFVTPQIFSENYKTNLNKLSYIAFY